MMHVYLRGAVVGPLLFLGAAQVEASTDVYAGLYLNVPAAGVGCAAGTDGNVCGAFYFQHPVCPLGSPGGYSHGVGTYPWTYVMRYCAAPGGTCPEGTEPNTDGKCVEVVDCAALAGQAVTAYQCATAVTMCHGGCTVGQLVATEDIFIQLSGECMKGEVTGTYTGESCQDENTYEAPVPVVDVQQYHDAVYVDGVSPGPTGCDAASTKTVCGETATGGTYCIEWNPCSTNGYPPTPVEPQNYIVRAEEGNPVTPEPDQSNSSPEGWSSSYWGPGTAPVSEPDTDGDGTGDSTDPDKDGDGVPNETDEPTFCEENPENLSCMELGDVQDQVLEEKSIGDGAWQVAEAPTGQCPADVPLVFLGQSFAFEWDPICDGAEAFRPVVLAMAWLSSAAFVAIGYRRAAA